MNNIILFRSNNDIEKDNYKVVFLLIIFLIFKIFYVGIYPIIHGNDNLYLVFKPIIIYFIYYLILILFNKKNDSYYIVLSLIMSFIVPIDTPLYVFIIGSIIGNIINYIFKDNVSGPVCSMIVILLFNGINMDIYTGVFSYIYLLFIIISLIYFVVNKLVKIRVILFSLISIILICFIDNNFLLDNFLFCLLFIVSDNRYSPITNRGQILGCIIFGIFIYIFKYILTLDYYLFLAIFFYEVIAIIVNYLGVKLFNRIYLT